MDDKRNPFDIFKHLPHIDESFLKEVTGMDLNDPAGILKSLSRDKWPPVDLVETFNEVLVTAEIPGLKRASDVVVKVQGSELMLEGEKVTDTGHSSNIKIHRQERQSGRFSRTISLPAAVDGKYARASYRQGVLEIRLTKLSGGQVETLRVNFYE